MPKILPRKSIILNSDSKIIAGFVPTNDDDIANKKYVSDQVAGISTSIIVLKTIFNYNTSSPISLGTLKANYAIKEIEIKALTLIDVPATFKIGKSGAIEDVLSASEIPNLQSYNTANGLTDTFFIAKSDGTDLSYGVDTALIGTLAQTGATAGQFEVFIKAYKI
jgi:hypothetical protein